MSAYQRAWRGLLPRRATKEGEPVPYCVTSPLAGATCAMCGGHRVGATVHIDGHSTAGGEGLVVLVTALGGDDGAIAVDVAMQTDIEDLLDGEVALLRVEATGVPVSGYTLRAVTPVGTWTSQGRVTADGVEASSYDVAWGGCDVEDLAEMAGLGHGAAGELADDPMDPGACQGAHVWLDLRLTS